MTALINRYVKVMADYGCEGLWDLEGCPLTEEEIQALGLDAFILNRLKKWANWYEANDDWSEESELNFDYEGFAKEGKAIAIEIKKRLPDYAIWYFDEWACQRDLGLSVALGTYSYEIKL